MSNENDFEKELLDNNDTEANENTSPASADDNADADNGVSISGSEALDNYMEDEGNDENYRQYRTDVKELNYRELTDKELEIQKKKNMFSCAFFGGILLIISLSVGAFMIFKSAPVYGYILPVVGLAYSGIQIYQIFMSKYGAFDGVITEKFLTSKNARCLKVWSEKEKQFCPMVEWYEDGWEELEPGSRVTVYKVNRQYHAEKSLD